MPLVRIMLRDAIERTLLDANTGAGVNVSTNRSWPTQPRDFPCILISAPAERKAAFGPVGPQFHVTAQIVVLARTCGTDVVLVEHEADLLAEQIELAVMTSDQVWCMAEKFAGVTTEVGVSTDAKQCYGEIAITFEIDTVQFVEVVGPAFVEADTTIADADSGETLAEITETLPQS